MAMGDFTPWFNQASVQPQTGAAPSSGAQAVTNALTTPATSTSATTTPANPYNRGSFMYGFWNQAHPSTGQGASAPMTDSWGRTPNEPYYGSNPGFWNFQGGGHQMGGGGYGGGSGAGSGGSM
jgi:hypothetical protein